MFNSIHCRIACFSGRQEPDEEVRSGVKTMKGMNNALVVPDLLIGADLMTTPDARTRTAVEELLESLAHED